MDPMSVADWISKLGERTNGHHKELTPEEKQRLKDEAVWAEEEAQSGPVVIPDIRDPWVRAEVKRVQEEQERRLDERLLATGLHVLQQRRG